jgi:hypothetical protein
MKLVGMPEQRFLKTKLISRDQRYVLILIFMEVGGGEGDK